MINAIATIATDLIVIGIINYLTFTKIAFRKIPNEFISIVLICVVVIGSVFRCTHLIMAFSS